MSSLLYPNKPIWKLAGGSDGGVLEFIWKGCGGAPYTKKKARNHCTRGPHGNHPQLKTLLNRWTVFTPVWVMFATNYGCFRKWLSLFFTTETIYLKPVFKDVHVQHEGSGRYWEMVLVFSGDLLTITINNKVYIFASITLKDKTTQMI